MSVPAVRRAILSTGPGDELAELLWDHGPALRRAPPPFQPFSCSAAGSSRAHELKRHAADATATTTKAAFMSSVPIGMHDAGGLGPLSGLPVQDDDPVPPWLHCPVVDDGDGDTAPLPPEYCASLLSEYSAPETPAVPTARAVPPEAAAKQAPPPAPSAAGGGGEGVMNFTFFSRPLQRPQAPAAAVESTVVQAATNRLRSTPLFSEQRMAWLQPPSKGPRTCVAVAPPPLPQPPLPQAHAHLTPPDHRHGAGETATVTQTLHRLQPEARAPDAVTSSVCSGNGDRSQGKRSSQHYQPADCSVSQDELDLDEEGGAMRRSSAARGSKRSRTAEVHNLSERRRRDRINEKMRALQELIPNCNKIDKASMLEEAIEYLKTLQLQVQMMSMGSGLCVPPMLLPAMALPHPIPMAHAHFPHLGMGLGFGVGAAAFDLVPLPRFPCPPMPMPPPGAMFGVPGQQAMPSPVAMFAHVAAGAVAGTGAGTAPPEQTEAAADSAPPRRGGTEHPPAPVAAQGDQELQHP